MKPYLSFSIVILLLLLANSCKEVEQPDCAVVVCTEEYKTISLTITDKDSNPVVLDDYYTFIDSRNRFKVAQDTLSIKEGSYPLVSDGEMDQLSFEGTVLIFVGVKNGQNLVEQQFIVDKDCCHIQLVSGETAIQLD